jgi:membrane-associated phospholipid phosphatase
LSLVFATASVVAFGRVTEDYLTKDPLARWDLSFARWLAGHRSAFGLDSFRVITDFRQPRRHNAIRRRLCVFVYRRRRAADAALVVFSLAGAELLNLVLKLAFHRSRPEVAAVHLDTYSYPSGHVMVATAGYGVFAFLLRRRIRRSLHRVALVVGVALIVAAIAFSRLYLGAHDLSDVLGGISAGAAWVGVALAVRFRYGGAFTARFDGSRLDRVARRIART